MKRRDFLKHTAQGLVVPSLLGKMGVGSLVPGLSPLASAMSLLGDTDKVLVLIYLNGGNDGLNTVVPLDQLSALNQARPHVILPENSLLHLDGTEVGLHPSLSDFKSLYDEDRLQIIQNVGYPDQNFSHFRSTDIWMSASDSDTLINSGWTGRYLDEEFPGFPLDYPTDEMPDPLAIEIGYGNSLLFQGPAAAMSMVIQDPSWFYSLVNNVDDPAPPGPAGDRLQYVRTVARQSQQYGTVVRDAAENVADHVDYPEDNSLAEQLKIVSKLIAGGLKTRMYLVSYGNFDTHDNQVEISDTTSGSHAYQLSQVGQAVRAFVDDLDFHGIGDRVMGMTFSEFGRRIVSNASYGTDHGSAAPMFLFGNKVAGGLMGQNPQIPQGATYGDNLEMEYDFRSVYSSVLEQWFCLSPQSVESILLDQFESLAVTKEDVCQITSTRDTNHKDADLHLSPNPTDGLVQISFVSSGTMIEISLYSLSGNRIDTLSKTHYSKGEHVLQYDLSYLPSGHYTVALRQINGVRTKKLIKI